MNSSVALTTKDLILTFTPKELVSIVNDPKYDEFMAAARNAGVTFDLKEAAPEVQASWAKRISIGAFTVLGAGLGIASIYYLFFSTSLSVQDDRSGPPLKGPFDG